MSHLGPSWVDSTKNNFVCMKNMTAVTNWQASTMINLNQSIQLLYPNALQKRSKPRWQTTSKKRNRNECISFELTRKAKRVYPYTSPAHIYIIQCVYCSVENKFKHWNFFNDYKICVANSACYSFSDHRCSAEVVKIIAVFEIATHKYAK